MSGLAIDLPAHEEQTRFNRERWGEICGDPVWDGWEGRIEMDRHGNVLMSPPAGFAHSDYSSSIFVLLTSLLEGGRAFSECPISTTEGVRAADVVWLSQERQKQLADALFLKGAPEICVEVLSPRNRASEMEEKKNLYFRAGAVEVWFCDGEGRMKFFTNAESAGDSESIFCPQFPARLKRD